MPVRSVFQQAVVLVPLLLPILLVSTGSVSTATVIGEEGAQSCDASDPECALSDSIEFVQVRSAVDLKEVAAKAEEPKMQVEEAPLDKDRSGGGRVAVVNNFHNSTDLTWLQGMKFDIVGLTSPRCIGESRPWLQWILKNYVNLPDTIVFLHGDSSSWHAQNMNLGYITSTVPTNIIMLADQNCFWKKDLPARIRMELPGLNALHHALFNKDFATAFEDFNMGLNYRCCAENIVTREAVMRFSPEVYHAMIALIDRTKDWPWGWIFERTWQNMWSQPLAPGVANSSIIASLGSTPCHDATTLFQASNDADPENKALARVLKAASSCGAPM